MEITRTIKMKPEFCDEKKPMKKKKRVPVNKVRITSYVTDLQGRDGYVQEEHGVRADS
jgi:hypothetical protein